MKLLQHPYFSLFCFFLNVWFGLLNASTGSYLFATICGLCAAVCFSRAILTQEGEIVMKKPTNKNKKLGPTNDIEQNRKAGPQR